MYGFEFDFLPGPFLAALIAVGLALPFLVAGAVIEARHYRRLAAEAPALASIRLIGAGMPGPGPAGDLATLGLVGTSVTLAPPPLGRFIVILRKLIGGRIDLYHRLLDRARRGALMRLRRQVRELGGDGALGVRLGAVRIGKGHVTIHAYGTAVRGLPAAIGDAPPFLPESGGSPPAPRKRALLILVVGGAAAAALAGAVEGGFFHFYDAWPGLKRFIARIFRI